MTEDRRKEIVRHLSEDDLDRLLAETDDEKISKRLTFVKRLYKGATLEDAADGEPRLLPVDHRSTASHACSGR